MLCLSMYVYHYVNINSQWHTHLSLEALEQRGNLFP